MKRNDFLRQMAILGVGMPLANVLWGACSKEVLDVTTTFDVNFNGKVLVIGAGSAGMTAAYLLARHNVDFEILEAAPLIGGRMRRDTGLADFPIDLGAEWIHVNPRVLSEMLSDSSIDASVDFINYTPQTISNWNNGSLNQRNWVKHFYGEHKFKNTTWFGFFEKYMLPKFSDKLRLNTAVTEIDYSGSRIKVKTDSQEFEADRVLITVPVKVLQREQIDFIPALPSSKTSAINQVFMGDGFKAFIKFSEKFYPDATVFGPLLEDSSFDKIFYDAAFRKGASDHVLGVFTINEAASEYVKLGNEDAIVKRLLEEMDEAFGGKASETYIDHVIQNWSAEPYIGGSYSTSFSGSTSGIMNAILQPVNRQLYFAGEALNEMNQATVHGASESAYDVVEQILTTA